MEIQHIYVLAVDDDWPVLVEIPVLVAIFLDLEYGSHRDFVQYAYMLIKDYRRPNRLPFRPPPAALPKSAYEPACRIPISTCVQAWALNLFARQSGMCEDF